jgi:hypothetical protein
MKKILEKCFSGTPKASAAALAQYPQTFNQDLILANRSDSADGWLNDPQTTR